MRPFGGFLLALFLLLAARAHAHPRFAKAEAVSCAYCHTAPTGGGPRNYRGLFYQRNSYTFAGFDDAAEAKKAGVPVGPNGDLKPRSLTAVPSPTATTAAGASLVPPITALASWTLQPRSTTTTRAIEGNTLRLSIPAQPEQYLQLSYLFPTPLTDGETLMVRFRVRADLPGTMRLVAQRNASAENDYAGIGLGRTVEIGAEYQEYVIPWTVKAPHAKFNKIAFSLVGFSGGAAKPVTLYLSAVSVVPAPAGLPPPTNAEPPIPSVDPRTIPDFARWQDPASRIWFVKIPAGSYRQGTTDAQREQLKVLKLWTPQYADEQPAKTVRISRPFLLSEKEVTQAEWRRVMDGIQNGKLASPSAFKGAGLPVDSVSYSDAQLFCRTLRTAEGSTGSSRAGYRLPSEAEWEYAARAGSDGLFPLGSDRQPISLEHLGDYAWIHGTAPNATGKAGGKKPNAWGLYDMAGNVWEWCVDSYSPTAYAKLPSTDPVYVSTAATERVLRGGCWLLEARAQRPAVRSGNLPTFRSPYVGLRLVREL